VEALSSVKLMSKYAIRPRFSPLIVKKTTIIESLAAKPELILGLNEPYIARPGGFCATKPARSAIENFLKTHVDKLFSCLYNPLKSLSVTNHQNPAIRPLQIPKQPFPNHLTLVTIGTFTA
jgi:hypothetical protein